MNRHLWSLRAFYLRYQRQCLLLSATVLLLLLVLVISWGGGETDRQPAEQRAAAPQTQPVPQPPSDPPAPRNQIIDRTVTQAIQDDVADAVPDIIADSTRRRIALIIDDLGNNEAAGRRAIELPASITFAVLPHTPHGRNLAELAHSAGREVMLHAPMSNMAGMALGEGGLTPELSEEEFSDTLLAALADIPHVQGVNNHTGSELTTLREQMAWVMRELKPLGLYFVDSVTTGDSVAADVAGEHQIPNMRRQVFLDNSADPDDIHFQFERLLALAERDGQALGIGHPYVQTLDYLEAVIPTLEERGFELVFVSELINSRAAVTDAP